MKFETISAADFRKRYGTIPWPISETAEEVVVAHPGKGRPEAIFLEKVRAMATALGWTLQHHEHDSRRSDEGWLDLTLFRDTPTPEGSHWDARMIFAELKVGKRRVTPEQQAWVDAHIACNHEVYVWRESESTWAEIERVLR